MAQPVLNRNSPPPLPTNNSFMLEAGLESDREVMFRPISAVVVWTSQSNLQCFASLHQFGAWATFPSLKLEASISLDTLVR